MYRGGAGKDTGLGLTPEICHIFYCFPFLNFKILTRPSFRISTKIQLHNLYKTSSAKNWANSSLNILPKLQIQNIDQTLCSKSEQKFSLITKPQLPNLLTPVSVEVFNAPMYPLSIHQFINHQIDSFKERNQKWWWWFWPVNKSCVNDRSENDTFHLRLVCNFTITSFDNKLFRGANSPG